MPTPEEKKNNLKRWLDTIQQDSWQLELIISGVVIFLLLGAYAPLKSMDERLALDVLTGSSVLMVIAGGFFILQVAYFSLLITFFLHLLLRGFWIGVVGLRSVSGDFDHSVLDYQPVYLNWLKKKSGSFDDYFERLEMQCIFRSAPSDKLAKTPKNEQSRNTYLCT